MMQKGKRKIGLHYFMTFPGIALFAVFFLIPIVQGALFAFTNWTGFNTAKFIGFRNFIKIFSDYQALGAIKNTVFYSVCATVLINFFGLLYAVILDSKNVRLKGLLRTLVYLPSIISPLIMGYIWLLILSSEGGVLRSVLQTLNAGHLFRDWLSDPKAALWVIVLINLWQNLGGTMIIYLSGLQSIPEEVCESGIIDGANKIQELFYLKLPLLAPALKTNIITTIIGSMSIFDAIVALTGGGPGYYTESLSMYIHRMSAGGQAGYAAAVSLVMFVIIIIPVTISFRFLQKLDFDS